MAKKGSSKKDVYVTHKKQTLVQRLINKTTGVRESKGLSRAEKQATARVFKYGRNAES